MKKKIVGIITILMILMPKMVLARQVSYVACGNSSGIPAPVPQMTSIAYTLLIIGTPLILIAFSIIALVKAITSGSQEELMKARGKLIKKFIAAGIIFIVAALVQFVITKAASDGADKDSVVNCINCFLYNEGCTPSSSGNDVSLPDGSTTTEGIDNNKPETGNSNNNNTGTNSTGEGTIFIGDSRTVGMCEQTTSSLYNGNCKDYYAVAQTSQNYSWFNSTAVATVNNKLNKDTSKKYNILVLMGINDTGNSSSYLSKIKTLATNEWKNHNITFVSITPIDSSKSTYSVTQSSINTFNNNIKSGISSSNLSNLSYCNIASSLNVSGRTSDGIHYNTELYKEMYNLIKSKCL